MKGIGSTILVGFVFGIILFYVLFNFPPFDNEKIVFFGLDMTYSSQMELTDNIGQLISYGVIMQILDMKVVYICVTLAFFWIVLTFAGLHMGIDKLFFRKYHEKPDAISAYRRGVFLFLLLILIIWLRLAGVNSLWNQTAVILLFICTEVLFVKKPWAKVEAQAK